MQGSHYPVFRCPRTGVKKKKKNVGLNLFTDKLTECIEENTFVNL